MSDPSHGVHQQLANHVHLISNRRFPILPTLPLDQAYRYLLDAPTIVKQAAPMSWTYLSAPQDGTVFLEWISRANGNQRFASDGYIWCDPEQSYTQEFNGYTIELLVHNVGFRPNADHYATHSRTRYHFIAKAPNVNAAVPDPSLWIVHYHQTEQSRIMDVRSLPIPPQMRQIMAERKWLESQGRLEQKDFMLHDRDHWPVINVPNSMQHAPQQTMYQQQQQILAQQMRGYQNYPAAQQHPAKRARHTGPETMPGGPVGAPDTSIEDEENTSLGDFFDHLTPREISAARYMQHHRWMEEIFSSPYAANRIVPTDLGLGLMGELKGLTEGILDPPRLDVLARELERPSKAKEAQAFTNLKKEQLDEFGRRVEKHLQDGQAEIERMKKEHAEKMAEWKKTKTVLQAEKRLRYATWEGHENAVPVFRLEVPPADAPAESTETVEAIVKEVEGALGVKIEAQKEATLIERGGLEEKEEPPKRPRDEAEAGGMEQRDGQISGIQENVQMGYGSNQPQHLPPQAANSQMAAPGSYAQPSEPQPGFAQGGFQQQTPQDSSATPGSGLLNTGNGDDGMADMTMDDSALMDDVDMDVDGDIDFIQHSPQPDDDNLGADVGGNAAAVEPPASTVQAPESTAPVASTATPAEGGQQASPTNATPAESNAPVGEPGAADASVPAASEPAPSAADQAPVSAEPVTESQTLDSSAGVFDDGTFDDLANMDGGEGDDGLLDFDGGMDMGGEESAFGMAIGGADIGDGAGGEGA